LLVLGDPSARDAFQARHHYGRRARSRSPATWARAASATSRGNVDTSPHQSRNDKQERKQETLHGRTSNIAMTRATRMTTWSLSTSRSWLYRIFWGRQPEPQAQARVSLLARR